MTGGKNLCKNYMMGGEFHSLVDKENEIPKAFDLNCDVRGVVSLERN